MPTKRVVLVSAAVAALGLAAAVLGFVAEGTKSKVFVGFDGQRCLYRHTPALVCGIAAALLALTGLTVATAASGCFGRGAPPGSQRRTAVARLSGIAWVVVVVAAVLFLYGAAMNRGGARDVTMARRRYGRSGYYYYGCTVLKNGVFTAASILSAVATACAVRAYICFQQTDEPAPAIAMGQPQWAAQPYPPPPAYPPAYPPPMGYPAPPQYSGYGHKQSAGTA